jgi:hypothetical protein
MESKNSIFFKIGFSFILLYVSLVQKNPNSTVFVMPVFIGRYTYRGSNTFCAQCTNVPMYLLPMLKQIAIVPAFTNPF